MVEQVDREQVEQALARYRSRRDKAASALDAARQAHSQGQDLSAQIAFGERMVAKFDYQIDHCIAVLEGRSLTPQQLDDGEDLFGIESQEDSP